MSGDREKWVWQPDMLERVEGTVEPTPKRNGKSTGSWRRPTSTWASSTTATGLTPAALAGYVGRTHLLLRLPKTAAPALREALAADPPARHRAMLLAGLARLVDADQAAVLRGKARTIGRQLGSRRVLTEVAR